MFEGIIAGIIAKLVEWATQYPIVASILMVIGVLRVVMKPLMDFLRAVVLATPGTGDDALLAKVEASKIYGYWLYFLDWIGSIKTPTRAAIERK